MFEFTEEEREHFKKLGEAHEAYMRKKYGDKAMDELEAIEKRMIENILADFERFAEITR